MSKQIKIVHVSDDNCGTSVISVFLCCSSFIFVLHCVQGTILFPKSKACSVRC